MDPSLYIQVLCLVIPKSADPILPWLVEKVGFTKKYKQKQQKLSDCLKIYHMQETADLKSRAKIIVLDQSEERTIHRTLSIPFAA